MVQSDTWYWSDVESHRPIRTDVALVSTFMLYKDAVRSRSSQPIYLESIN